jgi:uncharacterized protein involved in exopolysaccharide biosynthesis
VEARTVTETSATQPYRPVADRGGARPARRSPVSLWQYLAIGIVTAAITMVVVRLNMSYSAEALLRPQGVDRSTSRLSGLAAQLGVNIPSGAVADPTRYSAELGRSREVLGRLLSDTFTVRSGSGSGTTGTLSQLLKVRGSDPQDALHRGVVKLRKSISVTPDLQTGLLRVQVVTPQPDLSYQLATRLLRRLNEVNTAAQQQQAAVERTFVEGRLTAARMELESAERQLAAFESGNRAIDGSPTLRLERARLTRRVDLRQQLFVSLSQQYEQTRIEEVRSTPVLVVIDGPNGSVTTASHPTRDAVIWGLLAVGLTWLLTAGAELRDRWRLSTAG